jgi:hypothetical protein
MQVFSHFDEKLIIKGEKRDNREGSGDEENNGMHVKRLQMTIALYFYLI